MNIFDYVGSCFHFHDEKNFRQIDQITNKTTFSKLMTGLISVEASFKWRQLETINNGLIW